MPSPQAKRGRRVIAAVALVEDGGVLDAGQELLRDEDVVYTCGVEAPRARVEPRVAVRFGVSLSPDVVHARRDEEVVQLRACEGVRLLGAEAWRDVLLRPRDVPVTCHDDARFGASAICAPQNSPLIAPCS